MRKASLVRLPTSSCLIILKLTWWLATYPGFLILLFGIPFACVIIFCVLVFSGFFACVMGNGITNCCRRSRGRREDSRKRHREHLEERWLTREYERRQRIWSDNERDQERRRRSELEQWEKAQKRARKYQDHQVVAPEKVYIPPSSSINFGGSHRPTHGSSARIPAIDSLNNDPARIGPSTPSQIEAWKLRIEPGSAPDNVSLPTSISSQKPTRLQKRDRRPSMTAMSQPSVHVQDDVSMYTSASTQRQSRLQKPHHGYSAGVLSQWSGGSLSSMPRRSEDRLLGSIGSSSRLFDDRSHIRSGASS